MNRDDFYTVVELSDTGESVRWVHALSLGSFDHPIFGTKTIDRAKIQSYHESIQRRVRGIDLDINYDHREHHGKAAGWIQSSEVRADGLWLLIKFTDNAADAIAKDEYRYFSSEFTDQWTDPKNGTVYTNVFMGGALTNRPFLKDLKPLTLSEIEKETHTVDREALIALLGLSEDATDEQIRTALEERLNASDDSVSLEDLEVSVSKDGQIVVANGDNTQTFDVELPTAESGSDSEEESELATLAESNPAVAALVERVQTLESADRIREVTTTLSEVGNSTKRLAPSVQMRLRGVMVALSEQNQRALVDGLQALLGDDGIVDLSETDGRDPNGRREQQEQQGGNNENAIVEFTELVTKHRDSNDGMKYTTAVTEMARANPDLYREYLRATTRGA